jgi:hypothetical protein
MVSELVHLECADGDPAAPLCTPDELMGEDSNVDAN